jgi:hypothetical protein
MGDGRFSIVVTLGSDSLSCGLRLHFAVPEQEDNQP